MSIVDARSDAGMAARSADVVIRRPADQSELRDLSALLARIWDVPEVRSPGPVNVLTALLDTDGYVAGAWRNGVIVGASFGLTYLDHGKPCLRSQVTGTILPGSGVGMALKLHQREWAAAAGLERITWTFDPLVRRNGRFNLHRLGAHIVRYVPDFYGALDDGVNGAWPTDRCVVAWSTADRVGATDAAETVVPLLDVDDADGAPILHVRDGWWTGSADALSIATPADIVSLRLRDPDSAAQWSQAMKSAMTAALDAGHVGVDVSTGGAYRFRRQSATGPDATPVGSDPDG